MLCIATAVAHVAQNPKDTSDCSKRIHAVPIPALSSDGTLPRDDVQCIPVRRLIAVDVGL